MAASFPTASLIISAAAFSFSTITIFFSVSSFAIINFGYNSIKVVFIPST
jgi:hypothetical protein